MRPRAFDGFTLIEVVLALALIAIGVIALAPLFVYASQQQAAAGDRSTAGAAAVQRMEVLRATTFPQLVNGGSLDTDASGYHDDSDPEFRVRWTVADNPTPPTASKLITVRAIATGPVARREQDVYLITLRSR